MSSLAIIDASALIAAADTSEPDHLSCLEVLRRRDLDLVVPALVVAEAAYIIERRLGPAMEAAFIRGLSAVAIESPMPEDWPLVADLVEKYADFPLGTVDASIAVLAGRLDTDLIVTLDRRHFEAIRSPQGRAFRILPEPRMVHEGTQAYEATAPQVRPGGSAEASAADYGRRLV